MAIRAWTSPPQWGLLVGCAALACLTPPTLSPDASLAQHVLERIASNPATQPLDLDVRISSGVATVTGQIPDPLDAHQVIATVATTPGVMDVIANLRISDTVIQQRVVEALRLDPVVASVPVTVKCAAGEVTLRSNQTNADQRARMVGIAATVQGVVHVVDDMR